jgi:hypothetical protein
MKITQRQSKAAMRGAGERARNPDEVEALIARLQSGAGAVRPGDSEARDSEARFIGALAAAARAAHPLPVFNAQMRQRILSEAAPDRRAGRQPAAWLPRFALAATSAVMVASMAVAGLAAWPIIGSGRPAARAPLSQLARPPVPPMSIPPIAGAAVLHAAATSPSPGRFAFASALFAPGARTATDTPTPSAP